MKVIRKSTSAIYVNRIRNATHKKCSFKKGFLFKEEDGNSKRKYPPPLPSAQMLDRSMGARRAKSSTEKGFGLVHSEEHVLLKRRI